jgi:hypothetical protein
MSVNEAVVLGGAAAEKTPTRPNARRGGERDREPRRRGGDRP